MNIDKRMILPINCRYNTVFADKLPITTIGTLADMSDKYPIKQLEQSQNNHKQKQ